MIPRQYQNRGYVGLLTLLIAVAIMAFLMIRQYQDLGIITPKAPINTESGIDDATSNKTPIESAKNAKNMLESRDRNQEYSN